MTQHTAEYYRQRRLPARLERCETELERYQLRKDESLVALADRLSLPRAAVYILAGRIGYTKRGNGTFAIDSGVVERVSRDTGIPMGQLFEEAAVAARKRSEANGEGR